MANFKRSHPSNFSCNVHNRNVDIGFYALEKEVRECAYSPLYLQLDNKWMRYIAVG